MNDNSKIAVSILGAIVLGTLWYFGAVALLSAPLAQAVAVIGSLALSATASALALRVRLQMPQQSDALNALDDEVWMVDRTTGRITYRNAAAADRITAKHVKEIVPADQHHILNSVLLHAIVPPRCMLRIGGQIYRPSVTCVGGPRQLMLVLRDITQEMAEQRIKDEFISTVSHELRSPMTSIKGSMGLLLSNAAGELPKPARDLLEISHRNADRLVVILNDILHLQKIADEGMEFENAPVDASALVHEAIAGSSLFFQRFDLKIDVEGAQNSVVIDSDSNRILQVLSNLLTNAAKFSKRHSTITVILEEDGDSVTIRVRDQGDGIGPEDQKKIFERFADLENSDRQTKGGSGLGLSICKAIVERLGGSIGFESTEGVGTTFSFHLPKGDVADAKNQAETQMRDAG